MHNVFKLVMNGGEQKFKLYDMKQDGVNTFVVTEIIYRRGLGMVRKMFTF